VIREATLADYPAAFRVVSACFPDFVEVEAGFVHGQASLPPAARMSAWVAEERGAIVGWARGLIRHEESSGSANVSVSVLPSRRRRGLGTALLERALAHVGDAPRAFAFTVEDGREFAEAHGFRLSSTSRISALDPRTVDTSELDRVGVPLRSLEQVGPEEVFAVESEAALDVPEDEPPDSRDYEQWVRRDWTNPDFDWASGYAAWIDGRAVAISYPAIDLAGGQAANAFTGTLGDYRGRGLARLVKLAVIRRVAELGIPFLVTVNHETNAPMLAVNERLGFRPHGAHYNYVRERSGNGLRASAGST
jgi:GNAT superfamily N-acetyltransferase